MDTFHHIWWVTTHNTITIGIWWLLIVVLAGVITTKTLTVTQKILTTFYQHSTTQQQWSITLTQAVTWILKVTTWIVIIAIIASRIGVPPTLIAAMGTIIGAALGFGSQETVRDVVKGSIHLPERQFSVGDYVGLTVGGTNHEGTIKDVSLRTLTLATEENGIVTIPQGNITLIQNYSRSIGEFVVRLPFDTATPVAPIIEMVKEVIKDIRTENKEILTPYLTDEDINDIKKILNLTVRGVSSVDDGRIIIQVKGESVPGSQFCAKRALLKAIAGYLEANNIHFYSIHLPAMGA